MGLLGLTSFIGQRHIGAGTHYGNEVVRGGRSHGERPVLGALRIAFAQQRHGLDFVGAEAQAQTEFARLRQQRLIGQGEPRVPDRTVIILDLEPMNRARQDQLHAPRGIVLGGLAIDHRAARVYPGLTREALADVCCLVRRRQQTHHRAQRYYARNRLACGYVVGVAVAANIVRRGRPLGRAGCWHRRGRNLLVAGKRLARLGEHGNR